MKFKITVKDTKNVKSQILKQKFDLKVDRPLLKTLIYLMDKPPLDNFTVTFFSLM